MTAGRAGTTGTTYAPGLSAGERASGGRKLMRYVDSSCGSARLWIALAMTYLELIAPDPNQPAPATPRPYGVEGITQGALVGWAVAVDDIEAARTYARSRGFDPGPLVDGHREDCNRQPAALAGDRKMPRSPA